MFREEKFYGRFTRLEIYGDRIRRSGGKKREREKKKEEEEIKNLIFVRKSSSLRFARIQITGVAKATDNEQSATATQCTKVQFLADSPLSPIYIHSHPNSRKHSHIHIKHLGFQMLQYFNQY